MVRTVWLTVIVVIFALFWGTIILGVSSLSVAFNQYSLNTSLRQLDPEYQLMVRYPATPGATFKPGSPPA